MSVWNEGQESRACEHSGNFWFCLKILLKMFQNISVVIIFFFLMLSSGKMLVIPRQRIPNICKVKLSLIRFFFSHKLGRLCLCYSNRVNQCMDSDFLCCATHLCKHYFLWICALLIVFGRALGTAFGQDTKRCHRHRAEWNIQKLSWLFVWFVLYWCLFGTDHIDSLFLNCYSGCFGYGGSSSLGRKKRNYKGLKQWTKLNFSAVFWQWNIHLCF